MSDVSGPVFVAADGSREMFVAVQPLEPGSTIDGAEQFVRQGILAQGGRIRGEFTEATLGGEPGRAFRFTADKKERVFTFLERFAFKDGKVYFLVVSLAGGKPSPDQLETANQIMESFQFS